MKQVVGALCFLASAIAFVIGMLMGNSQLPAFVIPAINHGWSLAVKQQACLRASAAYFVIGIGMLAWAWVEARSSRKLVEQVGRLRLVAPEDFYRNCGMSSSEVALKQDGWAYGLLFHEPSVGSAARLQRNANVNSRRSERAPLLATPHTQHTNHRFLEATDSEELEMSDL